MQGACSIPRLLVDLTRVRGSCDGGVRSWPVAVGALVWCTQRPTLPECCLHAVAIPAPACTCVVVGKEGGGAWVSALTWVVRLLISTTSDVLRRLCRPSSSPRVTSSLTHPLQPAPSGSSCLGCTSVPFAAVLRCTACTKPATTSLKATLSHTASSLPSPYPETIVQQWVARFLGSLPPRNPARLS